MEMPGDAAGVAENDAVQETCNPHLKRLYRHIIELVKGGEADRWENIRDSIVTALRETVQESVLSDIALKQKSVKLLSSESARKAITQFHEDQYRTQAKTIDMDRLQRHVCALLASAAAACLVRRSSDSKSWWPALIHPLAEAA